MKRAIGYCETLTCEDYAKGVFLLNHGDTFYCPRCRDLGKTVPERGFSSGDSEVFKEVRLEFDFDAVKNIFKQTAIVRDESIQGSYSVYTLQSPLVKTDTRALKVAEAILSNLNRFGLSGDSLPKTTETLLSFDNSVEEFALTCAQLKRDLESSALAQSQEEYRV